MSTNLPNQTVIVSNCIEELTLTFEDLPSTNNVALSDEVADMEFAKRMRERWQGTNH